MGDGAKGCSVQLRDVEDGMPVVADDEAELRLLRRRAYGPDADIDRDPAALRRLRELEARRAGGAGAGPTEAPVPAPSAPAPSSAERAHPEQAPESGSASAPAPLPRRSWVRLAVLWAVSLVLVAVIAASVSWAVTRRVEADPRQVAALGLNPDQRLPTVFGVDQDGRRFADFAGFAVVALQGRTWMGAGAEDFCLVVMDTSGVEPQSNSYSGQMYGGCGAGGFPATVQVRVGPDMPEEIERRFPEGSALQFVLRDDEVVVLVDVRPDSGAGGGVG